MTRSGGARRTTASRAARRPALRDERGQAAVLALVFLTALLGMAALVLDIGAWYRADRDVQATADAAALAGAQAPPAASAAATSLTCRPAGRR